MRVTESVENTPLSSVIDLKIEELEQVLAPTPSIPIPPPLR